MRLSQRGVSCFSEANPFSRYMNNLKELCELQLRVKIR